LVIWLVCAAYQRVCPRHQPVVYVQGGIPRLAGYLSILINRMVVKVYLAGNHAFAGMRLPDAAMEPAISQCRWLGSLDRSGQGVGAESVGLSVGSPF